MKEVIYMSKKDIITFYNNINSFLVKHGYSLNKTYYYYDWDKKREIVRKYKTDEKSLKYLVDKDCSNIVFVSPSNNINKVDARLSFTIHSNFFRLFITSGTSIDFHKISEFFIWFNQYGKQFKKFYTEYYTIKSNIRKLESAQSKIFSDFCPTISSFRDEQERRWRFDKENFKIKRILGKLD